MYIVFVHVHVKPESVDAFRVATIDNARASLGEPGVARFDIVEEVDRPERFTLIEAYRSPADAARHKETSHYKRWRDAVERLMAEPRTSVKYENVFPNEAAWETPRA